MINALDLFADVETFAGEKAYYTQSVGETVAVRKRERASTAGMSVFDISTPAQPRKIGQLDVEAIGLHRLWYVGGRYAYAPALLDGFSDYIFVTIDLADPTKPLLLGR